MNEPKDVSGDTPDSQLLIFEKKTFKNNGPQNYYGRKRDQVYVHLKKLILSRHLKPGQPIDIQHLSRELDVSRTPIQEALSRLEQEGFIQVVPQVGVYVHTPTSQELFEKLLSRAVLEGLLAAWAARRISDEDVALLGDLLTTMEPNRVSAQHYAFVNREFHNIIYLASGLRYIQALVDLHWDLVDYAMSQDILFSPENMKKSYEEHKEIFDHLQNRRADAVRKAVEAHAFRVAALFREIDE
ncbi:GntR family transcriptional regulator [Kyrpidia tusciae]|uniref:Transcriptional regulator, GntR family n=1 Tax=Kyrpidia tusciae (strain DSM 2912 / NBRC 15312 / T2) TaxID=562970 RepID=D5WVJ2_KYRT2|nr:GntR family transcriptional regulator [Kyrpidia tusciae]ADG07535.1 transcriptional regulator, GntR family [Kyrpidia tusciae DSM 2912]